MDISSIEMEKREGKITSREILIREGKITA